MQQSDVVAAWHDYSSGKTIPKSSGTAVTVQSLLPSLTDEEKRNMTGFEIFDHTAGFKLGLSDVKTGTDFESIGAYEREPQYCTYVATAKLWVIAAADADIENVKVKIWGS